MRCVSWEGRVSALCSRSSTLTSSPNSLEPWDERGDMSGESAIMELVIEEWITFVEVATLRAY